MARDLQAYKAPAVLQRIAIEVDEPYRTLLLVHPHIANGTLARDVLARTLVADVGIEGTTVRIGGKVLSPDGARILVEYLRGWLAQRETGMGYLFPLPSDSSQPAAVAVAKRHLKRITDGKMESAPLPPPRAPDPADSSSKVVPMIRSELLE